jgi:hypothetical protein
LIAEASRPTAVDSAADAINAPANKYPARHNIIVVTIDFMINLSYSESSRVSVCSKSNYTVIRNKNKKINIFKRIKEISC